MTVSGFDDIAVLNLLDDCFEGVMVVVDGICIILSLHGV